jgi:hypothetical protein
MRKLTIAVAALTLLVAGYVLAQTTPKTLPFFKPPADAAVNTTAEAKLHQALPAGTMAINDHLALRIEGMHDGRAMGTLLTKVNGQWVEVMLASKNMRAATR